MNNFMRNQQNQRLSFLTLALLSSLPVHAATAPPDAGQMMRDLQKQPEWNTPNPVTPLHPEQEAAPKGSANDSVRIAVKAIHVSGSLVYTARELETLIADLVGGNHSFAELDAAAARITAFYREHGYVVARAYLPEQKIKDGVVVINVLEGAVGKRSLNNRSLLTDARANSYLSGSKSGDVLQSKPIDRSLLLLADTPGVGGSRATLQPGASVGTSDLLFELAPAAPYAGDVELDNYGNRYTGENRLGAMLAFNSPLKIGDQITLRALTTDQNMSYARVAYSIPLGGSGLRVGTAYSDTRYRLGREDASLQAHGTAISRSLYATYPFVRSLTSNLSGTLTWEDKNLHDQYDSTNTSVDKHVQLVSLGLNGNHKDALGGGGVSTFDLTWASGNLGMDDASRISDAAAQTYGAFTRIDYNLNRLQRLTDKNTLSVALSGQQANKNLNSSEQFSLGGAYGVRAYPQGEGIGDEGWLTNMELRHSFKDVLQGVVFYDAGSVTINRNPFTIGANTRYFSGAGLGANVNFAGVLAKAYVAWRGSGGRPTSIPATVNSSPMLWVQLSKAF